MVLNSISSPTEVIIAGTEGAGILGRTSTAAAGQTVHPGKEVLFEPPEQLQHQEVFNSNFTFYKHESKAVALLKHRVKVHAPFMLLCRQCITDIQHN